MWVRHYWYLISSRDGGNSRGSPPPAPPRAEGISWREERRFEQELESAERELTQARRDARADTQPETRAAWDDLIAEREAQVREARKRLEDYRSGR